MKMDINHLCRICLGNANLISLFNFRRHPETTSQCEDLSLKIRTCSDIEIFENDGLPDKICKDCETLLTSAYTFKILCLESDKKIRSSLRIEVIEYSFQEDNGGFVKSEISDKIKDKTTSVEGKLDNGESFEISYYNDDYSFVTQKYNKNGANFKFKSNEKNNTQLLNTDRKEGYDINPIHKEVLVYSCEKCQKSFTKRHSLKAHQFLHSGVKKYVCEVCGCSFARQDYLAKHLQAHLRDRPHTCPFKECNYSSAQRTSLVQHIRTHTKEKPFHCKECDFSSATSGNLLQHIRVMHRERELFKCEVCCLTFKRKDTLKEHISAMHCGIKPICDYCDLPFNTKSSLHKHLRCKHHLKNL